MPRIQEFKPLLFTTTIRNPERFKDFMFLLQKYDGQILTNQVIAEVEKDVFSVGLYRPTKRIPESVKRKWQTSKPGEFADEALTREEAQTIYDNNDPNRWSDIKGHKEAGFDKGWPSRFDTQYKVMKTLGFVMYRMGEPIRFSEVGRYLAQSVSIEITDGLISHQASETPEYEQMAYLQAFAKYQRCNPFIREKNDNIPLILLLQVIKKLNANPDYNDCGISYKEIPLVIFWKDNDSEALYQRIVRLRREYGYNPSAEVIQDICVNEILGGFKEFKLKSVVSEYPDEFVRKMRMTELVTFRGGGRFIDVNHCEDGKIDYIISRYSDYEKYSSEDAYFNYMSSIDANLFSKPTSSLTQNSASLKLSEWAMVYSWEKIKEELGNLMHKSPSKDNVLKFISAPARLEFLTALAIKSKLPDVRVIPNYSCDDTGLPTSTACGNKGDIECFERQNGILVEVTMATGRTQTMMEVWPIERHLSDFMREQQSQCVFIAPSIFSDSKRQIQYVKFVSHGEKIIRPYSIDEFVQYLDENDYLYMNSSVKPYPIELEQPHYMAAEDASPYGGRH